MQHTNPFQRLKLIDNLNYPIEKSLHSKNLIQLDAISLDFSGHQLSHEVLNGLIELSNEYTLSQQTQLFFEADLPYSPISMHPVWRAPNAEKPKNSAQKLIFSCRQQMLEISHTLALEQWHGYSGKPIEHIVHLGIGGSFLGPRFCFNALRPFVTEKFTFHFVSEADPHALETTVQNLNPHTTLFIVASNSFTTSEVLYNMEKAIQWLGKSNNLENHLIAITSNPKGAQAYNIKHILNLGGQISGRFSTTTAINLINCIAIGINRFEAFLEGAYRMDEHFRTAPIEQNLPAILALTSLWSNNYRQIHNHLILAFGQHLERIVNYLQQLEMESNGKSQDFTGNAINYPSAPIIWGGSGVQAQHSYFQLIAQGSHSLSMDLIYDKRSNQGLTNNIYHRFLDTLSLDACAKSHYYNQIILNSSSPQSIGQLIALYEHKVFCQSVFWKTNPFNQPGVEKIKSTLRRGA